MLRPLALLAMAALLAGCAGSGTPTAADLPEQPQQPAGNAQAGGAGADPPLARLDQPWTLRGVVVDQAVRPVASATVRAVGPENTATTGDDGAFVLRDLPPGPALIQAYAHGHALANVTVAPTRDAVRIQLQAVPEPASYVRTYHFRGILQCAFEAAIISPSCDSIVVALAPEHQVFEQNQSFPFVTDLGWSTLVVDVDFEPGAHPGLDGLRMALRGAEDEEANGTYEQFGRWFGSRPFTVRVGPGQEYPYGSGPVPGNFTSFRLDVYPHSHAYHTVCSPSGPCFLGVGAGLDVRFDVYVSAFHGEPAPAGFTLLGR